MTSFWSNKPLKVENNSSFNQILLNKELLDKIDNEVVKSRYQLDYKIYDNSDLTYKVNDIMEFINKYYITSTDSVFRLIYSKDLLNFYLKDSLVIEFFPKNNYNNVIGYIVGKRTELNIQNNILPSLEVNFLCLIPQIRNLGVSSYMINILTRECLTRYHIGIGHYTISSKINSPYFGKKGFYHRLINIDNLLNAGFYKSTDNVKLYKTVYNTFNYKYNFDNEYLISYINGDSSDTKLIDYLYTKYINYCEKEYDIYELVNVKTFQNSFSNKAFHHFIIKNKDGTIYAYVCLFSLNISNSTKNTSYKCGYYYYMWFNDDISNILEYIHEYIYKNNIVDMISFSDIFKFDVSLIKAIKSNSVLRYYLFNMNSKSIDNNKNGLITI